MPHLHDLGLVADLERLQAQRAERRRALAWLAAGAAGLLHACGGGDDEGSTSSASTSSGSSSGSTSSSDTGSSTGSTTGTSSTTTCALIPEETAGPYPGDGSNSNGSGVANALALSGIVRSDIRSSIDGASATASGVPLTVVLRLVNTNASCASLEGYAIYLWHCDAEGRYSMYSSGVTGENYLRGVQVTNADGQARFVTIFPGCYSGRMPHIHFEVYRSTTTATDYANKLKTSQLAFPDAPCQAVYATSTYVGSAANYAKISFATDNVFSDGVTLQLATVTGDTTSGYTATLEVGISV